MSPNSRFMNFMECNFCKWSKVATIYEKKMLERKNFEFDILFEFFNLLDNFYPRLSIRESICKIYQKEFYTRKSLLPLLSRPINKFHEI